ncbi:hypothetical protein [Nocardioides sp.]|uniref:hypothetical protein n=1 Tax=Nocardioides sp. TaxID=35761 RepID=UPI0035B47F64
MPGIKFLMHLPRLRLQADQVPLSFGTLVKPTWDSFDSLTLRAYSDWQRAYEAADPVFLLVEGDVDLPFLQKGSVSGSQMVELKMPSDEWDDMLPRIFGTSVFSWIHDTYADVVWAAFVLAAPGAGPGRPRTSVTWLIPDDGHVVALGGEQRTGIRVQGEADLEYLFSADTACVPLSDDDVMRAMQLVPVVQQVLADERLGPALRQLLATTGPTLTPGERLVLAVSALEGLLLPEVRVGLQDTFAQRVVALLGADLEERARSLYRARSKAVHDGAEHGGVLVAAGLPEQLLADVIVASDGSLPRATQDLRGSASTERLLPRQEWFSATFSTNVDLSSPEGKLVSWSPVIGLTYEGEGSDTGLGAVVLPFTPAEIISMENKDVRRDFGMRFVAEPISVAGFGVFADSPVPFSLSQPLVDRLLRPRNLAVVGLRIIGLRRFVDPELLGWYVYDGSVRHRRETVFRTTVLMALGSESSDELTPHVLAAAADVWRLLAVYDAGGRDAEVDRMLDIYRRTHDTYTNARTHATLLFALLEALLGRFRPAKDKVQLEELVGALDHVDPAAARWFAESGREMRNASAHGAWQGDGDSEELAHLRAICGGCLHTLLQVRSEASAGDLVTHLTARIG